MGIETVGVLGTAASESAGRRGGRRSWMMLGRGAIWYILSAVTGSPHEAPLEGEAAHAP